MVNNPELIEQTINNIKKLSKEDLDKVMKEADEWYNKEKINNITQRLNNKIEKLKQRISKMHPASDCVIIEELEIKLQVLEEILEEILEESKGEYKNG